MDAIGWVYLTVCVSASKQKKLWHVLAQWQGPVVAQWLNWRWQTWVNSHWMNHWWQQALCGLRGCKNGPAPFPGRMSYKTTKPGLALSVVYLSMFYVLLIIRVPFYVLLVFVAMCSVFWLFWLSYQYLPSDWPERLLWGSLIVARGSSPESPGRRVCMIFLVYCIASLFYYVFVLLPAPTWYIILLLWRDIACLCWKCR